MGRTVGWQRLPRRAGRIHQQPLLLTTKGICCRAGEGGNIIQREPTLGGVPLLKVLGGAMRA